MPVIPEHFAKLIDREGADGNSKWFGRFAELVEFRQELVKLAFEPCPLRFEDLCRARHRWTVAQRGFRNVDLVECGQYLCSSDDKFRSAGLRQEWCTGFGWVHGVVVARSALSSYGCHRYEQRDHCHERQRETCFHFAKAT